MSALRIPRLLLVPFALLLALALVLPLTATGVSAQTMTGQQPGIVATGSGEASGPAESASVQVLLESSAYAMGMMGPVATDDPAAGAEMEASPTADEAMPSEMTGMPSAPAPLSEDDVAPVVAAVSDTGVAEDEIEVIVPSSSSMLFGPSGSGGAQLRFSVTDPTQDGLRELAAAVNEAASGASLTVMHIGVRYVAADCDTLVQEARDAAVADARERAEGLAGSLGVGLGDLIQASDSPFFGPTGTDSCNELPSGYYGPYGENVEPPFDPAALAEATVYSSVTLTFAFGDGEGTPEA